MGGEKLDLVEKDKRNLLLKANDFFYNKNIRVMKPVMLLNYYVWWSTPWGYISLRVSNISTSLHLMHHSQNTYVQVYYKYIVTLSTGKNPKAALSMGRNFNQLRNMIPSFNLYFLESSNSKKLLILLCFEAVLY